jgi:hypothetical protein
MRIRTMSQDIPQARAQIPAKTQGKYSAWIPAVAKKANLLALGALAVYAASSLPLAEAGAGSYWACIQTCLQSMGPGWVSSIVCPTICAPFLALPG